MQSFIPKQGQYFAFTSAYTRVVGCAPAEVGIQRHVTAAPPSVHEIAQATERARLIRRQPGAARSIEVLVAQDLLQVPPLSQPPGSRSHERSKAPFENGIDE